MTYKKEIKEDGKKIFESSKEFFNARDKMFILTKSQEISEDGEKLLREGKVYDGIDGIELRRYIATCEREKTSEGLKVKNCNRMTIERNDDLVTEKVILDKLHRYDDEVLDRGSGMRFLLGEQQGYGLEGMAYSFNDEKPITMNKLMNKSHANDLDKWDIPTYEKLKSDIEEKRNTFDNGYIEEKGANLSPEKQKRLEEQEKWIKHEQNYKIKQSAAFRKVAEENGIVYKDSAQELE